ncbi:MAG: hypothetical protein ACRC8K_03710 [Waterburya sp.]
MNHNIDGANPRRHKTQNNAPHLDDKLSTKLNLLVQQAVDEAIEQHRIRGESIAISENGKVKIIPPEEIIPLADKLKKRKAQEQPQHKI